jgi:hypothetical protein
VRTLLSNGGHVVATRPTRLHQHLKKRSVSIGACPQLQLHSRECARRDEDSEQSEMDEWSLCWTGAQCHECAG